MNRNLVLIIAIIFGTLFDVLFIGGGFYLCAYKDWSLWTIFWMVVICGMSTSGLYEIIGVNK
jgi:hypothetical protein